VLNDRGGNPLLRPEVASTVTGGIVFTPSFIEGLQVSLDWYDISIKKSIVTLAGDPVQCAQQIQTYCNLLVFAGPVPGGKPSLTTVQSLPVNAAYERTSGMDAQIDYLMPFLDGDLLWHFVANYNDQHTIVNGGVTCNSAGVAGINMPAGCGGNNGFNPKFRGTLSAGYTEGPISATIQTRFSSAYRLNNLWLVGTHVDDNSVPWNAYLDLRGSYQVNENFQVYGAVDNILGTPPLLVPPLASGGSSYQSLGAVGDTLGRMLRVGVRFQAD
jgi:outer membrane receptor protein involved in Fe transport